MNLQLGDLSHIIQLSIAPVFLLTGVGQNNIVLTNRLARIIDRSRRLEEALEAGAGTLEDEFRAEYNILSRRGQLINYAITLSTSCALLICLVIASLFLGDALALQLGHYIAGFFVLAMLCLIGSFTCFLREIFIATHTFARPGVRPFKSFK